MRLDPRAGAGAEVDVALAAPSVGPAAVLACGEAAIGCDREQESAPTMIESSAMGGGGPPATKRGAEADRGGRLSAAEEEGGNVYDSAGTGGGGSGEYRTGPDGNVAMVAGVDTPEAVTTGLPLRAPAAPASVKESSGTAGGGGGPDRSGCFTDPLAVGDWEAPTLTLSPSGDCPGADTLRCAAAERRAMPPPPPPALAGAL